MASEKMHLPIHRGSTAHKEIKTKMADCLSARQNCTHIQETTGAITALLVGSAHGLVVIQGDPVGMNRQELYKMRRHGDKTTLGTSEVSHCCQVQQ